MIRLLLMLVLLPGVASAQGIYASLDGATSQNAINGTLTFGYHFKNGLHAGVGAGMSRVNFETNYIKSFGIYHPLFAELSFLFPEQKMSPYLSARGGILLNGRNGILRSPINIGGSYMGTLKGGLAFKRTNLYIIPFVQFDGKRFDKNSSRNVGVASAQSSLGAGLNLIFY